jgi:acyl-CoA hydrolase
VSLFTGAPLRSAVAAGRADFVPVFLSEVPGLFATGQLRLEAVLLELSPPDRHRLCTLGTSCDAARAAADAAPLVLAEINDQMPRKHGHTTVPLSRIRTFTHTDRPLPEQRSDPKTPEIQRIGELVAGLVEDGACLQVGIGAIPGAVLTRLGDKSDLGIHTEIFSDPGADLCVSGAVTNRRKAVHPDRLVTTLENGTQKVFDFVHDNPLLEGRVDALNHFHSVSEQSEHDSLGNP